MIALTSRITTDKIIQACERYGYWYPKPSGGDYDVFMFGVRSDNREQETDRFDDVIGVFYYMQRNPFLFVFEGTTDPGVQHMKAPQFEAARKHGTAILCEGQHRQAWILGFHGSGNWRHRAFQQTGKVRIYRDSNRDTILDMEPGTVTQGWYGINIHAASLWRDLDNIGLYSAGCQVLRSSADLTKLCNIAQAQISYGLGNKFSYTLFEESDFE